MAMASKLSVVSALCLLLVSGQATAAEPEVNDASLMALARALASALAGDTVNTTTLAASTTAATTASTTQDTNRPPPQGQGHRGPDVAQLLLQASLEEIEKNTSLLVAAQNIRETLTTAQQAEKTARAALDEALVPQMRDGQLDTSALASLTTAADEAEQASQVATIQALDDARSLLSNEQRASVIEATKAKLATAGPGGQGATEPGGPGSPRGPGGQRSGGAPPDTSTGPRGASFTGAPPDHDPLAGDPLLAGLTLTDAQKQELASLGYLGEAGLRGNSIQNGDGSHGAPPGPPPLDTDTLTTSTTSTDGSSTNPPKNPGSELLEVFASEANELPLPATPQAPGGSSLAERVRRLAILAEVLDSEQRGVVADRLGAEATGVRSSSGRAW